MFFHRRKFMRSVAVSAFKNQLTKAQVDEVLEAMSLGADARTEQLSVVQLQELSERFRQQVITVTGESNPVMENQGQ
jgi:16S rRNA (adenine1518-N6/adenine1519-N6)-dimethyltransferase